MPRITLRVSASMSTHALVVISPATMATPVLTSVSQATCACLSCARIASRTASDIWSATLSGWPSETDSEVNRWLLIVALLPWVLSLYADGRMDWPVMIHGSGRYCANRSPDGAKRNPGHFPGLWRCAAPSGLRRGGEFRLGAGLQRIEILAGQPQLLVRAFRAVDHGTKRRVFGTIPGIPAQVLARDAHALMLAVECVQILQMPEQDVAYLGHARFRQEFAGREVMRDFAEDPRPALRRAADHHRIRSRVIEDEPRLRRRIDVAVGDHRDRNAGLHRGDGVVLGHAFVFVRAGAAMHGERRDARVLRDARDVQRVAVFAVPAGADLQRDRHVHRSNHRRADARDQRLVLQQRRARPYVADLLRRAAHVDVDDLGAVVGVVARGF